MRTRFICPCIPPRRLIWLGVGPVLTEIQQIPRSLVTSYFRTGKKAMLDIAAAFRSGFFQDVPFSPLALWARQDTSHEDHAITVEQYLFAKLNVHPYLSLVICAFQPSPTPRVH